MEVPEGFEKYYAVNMVLKLQRVIYGLKQAAVAFWKELLTAMMNMKFFRNETDPCLYYRWNEKGLSVIISWEGMKM